MMTVKTTSKYLDFSRLSSEQLVSVDNEKINMDRLESLKSRYEASGIPWDVHKIKWDPGAILQREDAHRETLLRQQINDAADALRFPFAKGDNLDYLALTYHGVERATLIPENPKTNTPPIMEKDDDYLHRVQLAPEAKAEYGLTSGGYVFKVMTAFAKHIKSAQAIHRGGGFIDLRVLGRHDTGAVGADLIHAIYEAFKGDDASQDSDILSVNSAEIKPYQVHVVLGVEQNIGHTDLKVKAASALWQVGHKLHALNTSIYTSALAAHVHHFPVKSVRILSPLSDIMKRLDRAPYMENVTVEMEVV